MTQRFAESNAEKAELEGQIDELSTEQQRYFSLKESYKNLESDRDKERKMRTTKMAEIDTLNSKVLDAHKQLEEERRRYSELKDQVNSLETEGKSKQLLDI